MKAVKSHCPGINETSTTGYVGAATVAGAAWWFLYDQTGPAVSYYQLVSNYFICVINTSSEREMILNELTLSSCAVSLHAVPR